MIDHGFTQIGSEDLDTHFRCALPQGFENTNGKRINLFACSAAWYPDAQFPMTALFSKNGRQKALAQCGEELGIAKKPRHVDEQVVEQRFDFFGVAAQKTRVLVQFVYPA